MSPESSLDTFLFNNSTIDVVQRDLHYERHLHIEWDLQFGSACSALRSVSKEFNLSTFKTVYYAYFESHLWYALPFWGTCCATQFERIFKLQNNATRYSIRLNIKALFQDFFKRSKILTRPSLFTFEFNSLIR